jgi:hypothetical protein
VKFVPANRSAGEIERFADMRVQFQLHFIRQHRGEEIVEKAIKDASQNEGERLAGDHRHSTL